MSWILTLPRRVCPYSYEFICSLLWWPWCQMTQNPSDFQLLDLDGFKQRATDTFSRDKNYFSSISLAVHHRANSTSWNQNQFSWMLEYFPKKNWPVTNIDDIKTYLSGVPTTYRNSSIPQHLVLSWCSPPCFHQVPPHHHHQEPHALNSPWAAVSLSSQRLCVTGMGIQWSLNHAVSISLFLFVSSL